ncbi:autotransporter outer membrane beta-barrel domain-containing protein [Flexibacterium corallicola]|uniref:autotransporter outer membrane beta-barrel domain-containing protein n=1 Tax=Flexibacterium corallicola TaxID=3037259 RepID=UPI00286EDDD7|nr:autotransporter outer membrane beta-barrel domain-containing protein [Pseudovibrio sp. M1P-2-3]
MILEAIDSKTRQSTLKYSILPLFCLSLSVPLQQAGATETNISDAQTTTQIMFDQDQLNIFPEGSISVFWNPAVFVWGDGNTLVNDGILSSVLSHAVYIYGDNNTLGSNGSIYAGGRGFYTLGSNNIINNYNEMDTGSDAFYLQGDGNTVASSGPISAGGYGIWIYGASNSFTNYDMLTTGYDGARLEGEQNFFENSGDIEAAWRGVYLLGVDDTALNSGTITALTNGIQMEGTNGTVINSGTLSAGAYGALMTGDNNWFENSGLLVTGIDGVAGAEGYDGAWLVGENNSFINSGSLHANWRGVSIWGDGGTAVNTGEIFANSFGIELLGSNSSAENFGRIEAGWSGFSITGDNHTSLNSGTILSQGDGVIIEGNGNTFDNGGTVFVDNFSERWAVGVEGRGNSVSLLNGTLVQGKIEFIKTGDSASPNNTLFIDDGYDAIFTISGDMEGLDIEDNSQQLYIVDDKVISFGASGFTQPLQREATTDLINDLTRSLHQTTTLRTVQAKNRGYWTSSSIMGQVNNSSDPSSYVLGVFTAGADWVVDQTQLLGVYGGYAYGRLDGSDDDWDTDIKTGYLGGYYTGTIGTTYLTLDLLGGASWSDAQGLSYLDNTVRGGINTSDQGGDTITDGFFSPAITVSQPYLHNGAYIIPSLTGSYTFSRQGSFDASGLDFDSASAHQISLRTQLSVDWEGTDYLGSWRVNVHGGLDLYHNWGEDLKARVGGSKFTLADYDNDTGVRPFVGADVTYDLGETGKITIGTNMAYDSEDAINVEGRVGVLWTF